MKQIYTSMIILTIKYPKKKKKIPSSNQAMFVTTCLHPHPPEAYKDPLSPPPSPRDSY